MYREALVSPLLRCTFVTIKQPSQYDILQGLQRGARTKAPVLGGEADIPEAPGSGAIVVPAGGSPVICRVLVIVVVRVALPPFGRRAPRAPLQDAAMPSRRPAHNSIIVACREPCRLSFIIMKGVKAPFMTLKWCDRIHVMRYSSAEAFRSCVPAEETKWMRSIACGWCSGLEPRFRRSLGSASVSSDGSASRIASSMLLTFCGHKERLGERHVADRVPSVPLGLL